MNRSVWITSPELRIVVSFRATKTLSPAANCRTVEPARHTLQCLPDINFIFHLMTLQRNQHGNNNMNICWILSFRGLKIFHMLILLLVTHSSNSGSELYSVMTCTVGVINDKEFIIFTNSFPLRKSVLPRAVHCQCSAIYFYCIFTMHMTSIFEKICVQI